MKNVLILSIFVLIFIPSHVQADCDDAHWECNSECNESIYDYDSGEYLYNTDFESQCEDACDEGRDACEGESRGYRRDAFEDECEDECPTSVYDYDSGEYSYNTDANSKCEDACEEGADYCE